MRGNGATVAGAPGAVAGSNALARTRLIFSTLNELRDNRSVARSNALLRLMAGACALATLFLAGCEEPDPRFEAPLVSGVITLPMADTQRFDEQLSATGFVAALRGGGNVDIDFSIIDTAPGAGDAGIVVAHLPADRFDPRVLAGGVAATGALAEGGQTLVVGSGFVSEFDPVSPLGLLQVDGEVLSALTPHGYTRILGVRRGARRRDVAVVGRSDYHRDMFASAIQVGPGIVEGGELDISPRERNLPAYVRAFVVTCPDRWLAGVTQTPMHLIDVGERLLGFFDSEGLGCDEVVNLSGDREALLAVLSEDGRSIAYFGNPTLPKASMLAFASMPD